MSESKMADLKARSDEMHAEFITSHDGALSTY